MTTKSQSLRRGLQKVVKECQPWRRRVGPDYGGRRWRGCDAMTKKMYAVLGLVGHRLIGEEGVTAASSTSDPDEFGLGSRGGDVVCVSGVSFRVRSI